MSLEKPLRGACSCGRNRYTIAVPQDATEIAQVFFDNSSQHRRHQAAPLTAWIRVPLSWFQSTTISYYPDETHAAIRRAYTAPSTPYIKRHFCGFCSTPISYWTEQPREEAEFISITLGSLVGEDLHDLEELGLLPRGAGEDAGAEEVGLAAVPPPVVMRTDNDGVNDEREEEGNQGVPWFETMMHGSELGRMGVGRRTAGTARSGDGRISVEWEIMDWDEGGKESGGVGDATATGKRKIGEVSVEAEGGDTEMKGR
ncbi:MAG: hypothetical protein M1827_006186 [Pycnora praestabilis]|nr:MAG: hypothetical protein M1827_006186 [Pycnora praestabilis]